MDSNHVIYCVGGLFICSYLFSTQSFGSSRLQASESRSIGRTLLAVSTTPETEIGDACYVFFGDTGYCLFKVRTKNFCVFDFRKNHGSKGTLYNAENNILNKN